jgi:hypothetical protein
VRQRLPADAKNSTKTVDKIFEACLLARGDFGGMKPPGSIQGLRCLTSTGKTEKQRK